MRRRGHDAPTRHFAVSLRWVAMTLLAAIGVVAVAAVEATDRLRSRVAWAAALDRDYDGVLRSDTTDCGPAALAMALRHHGIEATVEAIAREAGTDELGTTLLALRQAAERRGVRAAGWRMSFEDLHDVALPVVAHVHGDHFVVVRSLGDEVVVDDPSLGRLRMNERVFRHAWDGVVLTLEVGRTLDGEP